MRIALIGSRDVQQFPTISYGGIETCVENLAWGLHNRQKDFICVVPKRAVIQDYPFEIVESHVAPLSGPEDNVWPFAQSLPAIVKKLEPDVIWSQSFWSAETLQTLGIPIICTFHDFIPSLEKKQQWFRFRKNTWYRFISQFQYHHWVDPGSQWQCQRSFFQHTGLADDEFVFGPEQQRENYYLWVAGLNWGWKIKGLDIFIELARRNPDKRFVAFGTGHPDIEKRLFELNNEIKGFEFRGVLKRGQSHQEAFLKAKAFIMPTQMPEPFGRTIVESISKGTPVLGSKNGALPELIKNGISGYTTGSIEELEKHLESQWHYNQCFEYSKRFHINSEIDALVRMSEKIIAETRGEQMLSSPWKTKGVERKNQSAPLGRIPLRHRLEITKTTGASDADPSFPELKNSSKKDKVGNKLIDRDEAAVFKRFRNRIENEVYSEPDSDMHMQLIDKMLPQFVRYIPDRNIDILDVGCGQGYACRKFRALGFHRLIGITLSMADVTATRKHGFECYPMDMTFLKFENHAFGALWVRHALEHSPYPYLTLLEFNRVLKPMGMMYLEMPMPDTPRGLESWPNHYSLLGQKMWSSLFNKSGFNIVFGSQLRIPLQAANINDGQPFDETNIVCILQKVREETL